MGQFSFFAPNKYGCACSLYEKVNQLNWLVRGACIAAPQVRIPAAPPFFVAHFILHGDGPLHGTVRPAWRARTAVLLGACIFAWRGQQSCMRAGQLFHFRLALVSFSFVACALGQHRRLSCLYSTPLAYLCGNLLSLFSTPFACLLKRLSFLLSQPSILAIFSVHLTEQ